MTESAFWPGPVSNTNSFDVFYYIDHGILSLTLNTLAKAFYVLFFRQKRNTKRRKLKPQRQQVDQTSAERGKKRHDAERRKETRNYQSVQSCGFGFLDRRQDEGPRE
jgi:hypothetical protein